MPHRLLAIGEVLWDVFPHQKKLGGAPSNFACLSHRLGASSDLISRVGDDDDGREIRARLAEVGLPLEGITIDPKLPTGVVNIELADGQPSYTIETDVAWDNIVADETALRLAKSADAVCFGTLAQRSESSRSAIQAVVHATRADAVRILDVNLRPPFVHQAIVQQSVELANALKLNQDELQTLAEMLPLASHSANDRLAEVAQRYDLRLIVLTRGDSGSILYAGGERSEHPGKKVKIVDAVGAGDAFTAATTLGYLLGWELDKINAAANEIAAFVCTQPGATPPIPPELREPFAAGRWGR